MFRFLGFRVERGLLIGRLGAFRVEGFGFKDKFSGGGGPKAWV